MKLVTATTTELIEKEDEPMFNVIITLNPQDHKYCGLCRFNRNARSCTRQCFLFHQKIPDCRCRAEAKRLPECIEAERKATTQQVDAERRTTFLPCPFCGNKTVTLEKLGFYAFVLRCKECYAKTRVGETEDEVAGAWNRRHPEVFHHDQVCNITQRRIMGYHSEQVAIDAEISTLEKVLEKVRLMIEEERKGMGR